MGYHFWIDLGFMVIFFSYKFLISSCGYIFITGVLVSVIERVMQNEMGGLLLESYSCML